jgi:peroxiredoxin Q/BCP
MLAEGTRAPDFRLPDHRGAEAALTDLRGRWVVLWWFVQADTPG